MKRLKETTALVLAIIGILALMAEPDGQMDFMNQLILSKGVAVILLWGSYELAGKEYLRNLEE